MPLDFVFTSAHNALKRAKRVLIVAHKKPDGDALGATSALRRWCSREGIAVANFCVDAPPVNYLYLHGIKHYTSDPAVFGDGHEVIVVVDCGDLRHAGVVDHLAPLTAASIGRPIVINIDHHVTNEMFGDLNMIDATASSACEMVYRFFVSQRITIDQEMATALLTGIFTDTTNFSNPATTRGSFEAASHLLQCGARYHDISRNLQRNKSVGSLRLWGSVLSRLKYNERLGVASTVIFARDLDEGATEEHVEGVSNFLNQFLDAKVIMVLRETKEGQVRGSLRSIDGVDVSQIAKLMGGGGHKKAAGFAVTGRIVEEADGWRVENPS